MFGTMCEKPLSLVPVCLPWQAPISPSGRTKFSLYYKNSFVDVLKEKKKQHAQKNTTLEQIIHHKQSGSMKGDLL